MWRKSHRTRQTLNFATPITVPWVASWTKDSHTPATSSQASGGVGAAAGLLAFCLRGGLYVAGQSAGRRFSIPRPGGRASRGWGGDQVLVENGAAVNALFTGAGAD